MRDSEVTDPRELIPECKQAAYLREIALWERSPDRALIYYYGQAWKEEMRNFVFGNNARIERQMIGAILLSRGITGFPDGLSGDFKVTTL